MTVPSNRVRAPRRRLRVLVSAPPARAPETVSVVMNLLSFSTCLRTVLHRLNHAPAAKIHLIDAQQHEGLGAPHSVYLVKAFGQETHELFGAPGDDLDQEIERPGRH